MSNFEFLEMLISNTYVFSFSGKLIQLIDITNCSLSEEKCIDDILNSAFMILEGDKHFRILNDVFEIYLKIGSNTEYKISDKFTYKFVFGYLKLKIGEYTKEVYVCENYFQVCFSILDYILNLPRNSKILIKKCSVCGRFFIADNGNQKFCDFNNKNLVKCREIQRNRLKQDEIYLLEKRLYNRIFKRYEYSERFDFDASEIKNRKDLLDKWLICNRTEKVKPEYKKWLINCTNILEAKNDNKDNYAMLMDFLIRSSKWQQ